MEIAMNHEWTTLDGRKYMLCINTKAKKANKVQKKKPNHLNVYLHSCTSINAYWLAYDEQLAQMKMHASVKRVKATGHKTKQTSGEVHFLLADQAWRASRKHRKVKTSLSILRPFLSQVKKGHLTLTQYQHGHFKHENRAMNKEHYVYYLQALIIRSC